MARVTISEVQAWLKSDRITVTADDLNAQHETNVLSRIEGFYTTSGWTNSTNTPKLVRQVIGLLNAATILRKAYSDQDDDIHYATILEHMAEDTLSGICSGGLVLTDLSEALITAAQDIAGPSFFPTDTETDEVDGLNVIKFTMGEVF
jgi:hypothetical protein